MKALSATSAVPSAPTETPAAAPPSASSPTPASSPSGGYLLAGPSDLPDPLTHAYRKDLADVALAGRVIASHYAEPLKRALAEDSDLLAGPEDGAEVLARLAAGETLDMLDNSRGWAWGYAGSARLVGYVRSEMVSRS